MTKLSLDAEPPSKFEGKKETNKKRNENIPRLIVFLRTEKNKNKTSNPERNLERKLISDKPKNIFDVDYLKSEGNYIEESLTLTNSSIEFTNSNTTSNSNVLNSNYIRKENNIDSTRKDLSRFYDMNFSYSFIPETKEKDKREDLSYSREQETKETIYATYNLDEDTAQEN